MPRVDDGGPGTKPKPKSPLAPLIRPKAPPVSLASKPIPPAYTYSEKGNIGMAFSPYGINPTNNYWTPTAYLQSEKTGYHNLFTSPSTNALFPQPAGAGGGPGLPPAPPPAPAGIKPLWEVKWKPASYDVPGGNKPGWWVNLQPIDPKDAERPDVQYLMMLNSTLPYLSPEDQRNAAAQIYTTAADAFSAYKPEKISAVAPINLETQLASPAAQAAGTPIINEAYFGSSQRASEALQALSNMREATVQGNRWKLGPGYTWLQSLLGAMGATRDLSPNNGQRLTATQTLQMLGRLDPLLAQGQSQEIGPSANIGRLLSQPFFSGGNIFGAKQPNPLLGF